MHYWTVRSIKNVALLTEDGAFALFFRPHPGGFASSRVPTPGNLPSKAKKMLIPGVSPGGAWAQVELTDALCQVSMFSTSPMSTKCDRALLLCAHGIWAKLFTALISVIFQINTHFTDLLGKRCWNCTFLLRQKPFWSVNIQENLL